ncbi:FHA domain-containing protein [Ananas comosus]|uniref:FHA domain-containing protein n=1 Tax=Ananas comosus TaxID=4615 RepID=A0A199VRR6_ANACO|nr:FHA domain-containing protein [Ananas comosus]
MDEPILQLLVEKGRRKGESVECKPGAALRLGRVVRGNTFALRDPGVSQKHLSFEFLREASRWVVTDLDTSNGTVLNGSQIAPSVPVPLSDGDAIKIGETTYISVKIAGGRPRTAAEDEAAVGRRGRRRAGAPLPPARSEVEMPLDSAVEEVSEASVANGRGKGRGRGRPRRAAAASAGVSIKDEIVDAVAVEESVPEVKERTRGRRPATRGSSIRASKEAEKEERQVSVTVPDLADQEAKEEKQRLGTRRPNTRATSARFSKQVEKETESSILPPNSEVAEACEDGNLLMEGNDDSEEQVDGERQREREGEDKSLDEGGDNMDNMTLGEWFERMEKFLPQVINDISEEIISILKEKAERFDVFIATNANAG